MGRARGKVEVHLFRKKTVIITGAGASVHYGYPTGAGLIGQMHKTAARITNFYDEMSRTHFGNMPMYLQNVSNPAHRVSERYEQGAKELREFLRRLTNVDPVIIDYFLGQNLQLEQLGKLLIAWVILEAESKSNVSEGNWLKYMVHQLALDCQMSEDIFSNRVQFISFNYDTSLERRLTKALGSLSIFDEGDVRAFCGGDRFLHVYGSINNGDQKLLSFDGVYTAGKHVQSTLNKTIEVLDSVYEASKRIAVIDPNKKITDGAFAERLALQIREAEVVYILGFGFDATNLRLLGFNSIAPTTNSFVVGQDKHRDIYVTNFGNISKINQIIGKTFVGEGYDFKEDFRSGNWFSVRKSVGNVDMALSTDFDIV